MKYVTNNQSLEEYFSIMLRWDTRIGYVTSATRVSRIYHALTTVYKRKITIK